MIIGIEYIRISIKEALEDAKLPLSVRVELVRYMRPEERFNVYKIASEAELNKVHNKDNYRYMLVKKP